MKTFNTKTEANEYMNTTYPGYASTGVANIIKVGPQMARHLGCEVGYAVKCL